MYTIQIHFINIWECNTPHSGKLGLLPLLLFASMGIHLLSNQK